MQYHLDTVPVWESMERSAGCPLCDLHSRADALETERALGASVMEPAERIKVNQTGICREHHCKLGALQNRLGHALLTDSHTKETIGRLKTLAEGFARSSGRGFLSKPVSADALARDLRAMCDGCVLCSAVEAHMRRYEYTFVRLWKTDARFRQTWEASDGVCLPHAAALVSAARDQLGGGALRDFASSILSLTRQGLEREEKELEWFTLKFDYRNREKPWGNSKDALERTAARLRGGCALKK